MNEPQGSIQPVTRANPSILLALAALIFICIHTKAGNGNNSGLRGGIENVDHPSEGERMNSGSLVPGGIVYNFLHTSAAIPDLTKQSLTLRRKRNLRREHFAGLSFNLLGPTLGYGSVSMNYSIGNTSQFEAGIDLSTVYAGFNLYPVQINRGGNFAPYMGLMVAYGRKISSEKEDDIYMYMPVGVRYLNDDNWFFSVEVAATTADHVSSSPFYAGIKLGYLFRQ